MRMRADEDDRDIVHAVLKIHPNQSKGTFMKPVTKRAFLYSWILIAGLCGGVQAATITVNPGQSIQAAVNSAVAGDIVQVKAGTYNQKILISQKNGNANNFITIKADAGAVITGAGLAPSGREGLISIKNSSYIKIDGFEITNFNYNGANTPVGILVTGYGSNIQILRNKIHDIKNTSTCTDPCGVGAHGLAVFGTHANGITDLLLKENEVYSNILQASEALVVNGNVDRFEVLDNKVHDNNNIGFDFIGYENECANCGENDRARNGIVRGNTAKNNSSVKNPWYGGQGSAGGFYVDGGRYIVFDRNISTGNDIGFEFASEHANKATEDIMMMDNFVFSNREAGLSVGGYSSSTGGSRRINVHNNSFYKNKGWGTEITFQNKVSYSNFSNNIIFGKGSADESYDDSGSGHSQNVWGKNLWWGTDAASSSLPGARIVADPKYVSAATGDLNIQSTSPAIDVGAISADVTGWASPIWQRYFPSNGIPPNGDADINGHARVQNIIDLGAVEYQNL